MHYLITKTSPVEALEDLLEEIKDIHDRKLRNCGMFYVREESKKATEDLIHIYEKAIQILKFELK